MKVLVLGSNGFFGRNVVQVLSGKHDVTGTTRRPGNPDGKLTLDLLDRPAIAEVLQRLSPEVLINAAGIVENTDLAAANVTFTTNILEEAVASGLRFKSIIISGSAAEYGILRPEDLPVKETAPLKPAGPYGRSKVGETTAALKFRSRHHLPIVIARIFNPLGVGMGPRFLISALLRQVHEIRRGARATLEVSRLDSKRDCLHIQDAALAIQALIEGRPQQAVYNIGSGQSTSNGELIELILSHSRLPVRPQVIETSSDPEPLVASQADIGRITTEFGWRPVRTIDETVKEIIDATAE